MFAQVVARVDLSLSETQDLGLGLRFRVYLTPPKQLNYCSKAPKRSNVRWLYILFAVQVGFRDSSVLREGQSITNTVLVVIIGVIMTSTSLTILGMSILSFAILRLLLMVWFILGVVSVSSGLRVNNAFCKCLWQLVQ